MIVDHAGKVVRRPSVALQQHLVVYLRVLEGDGAVPA
jgi:hypothetical protein